MGERASWPRTGEVLADGRVALHVGHIWTDMHRGEDIGEVIWQSRGRRHSRALTRQQCLNALRLAEDDVPNASLSTSEREAAGRIIRKVHQCLRALGGRR
ncbi:hypothetical protein [Candidatus Poriferisodalis sp.]|uniref:hypothetical protein n=1 Tax=Candidatus Poriferisodalis sp. TaxID=3101277 RepID=UPI003B5B2BAB